MGGCLWKEILNVQCVEAGKLDMCSMILKREAFGKKLYYRGNLVTIKISCYNINIAQVI